MTLLLVLAAIITALPELACGKDTGRADLVYVDYKIDASRCTNYDPVTRRCGDGTQVAYRSLRRAAEAAVAGQTVLVRAGTYCEQLKPKRSGRRGRYIAFKSFDGEKAVITGPRLEPAIDISDRSYIVIEGFDITNVARWLYALRSHHNIIRNNRFSTAIDSGHSSKTGLFFQHARLNKILDNIIQDSNQDGLSLVASDRNVVAGNIFRKAYHTLWTIKGGSFNVLRNNHFHNAMQKIGEVYDCHKTGFNHELNAYNCTKHNLIERNVFAYTPSSGRHSPYSGIQYAGQNGIIRGNVFHDTVGPGLSLTLYGREANYNMDNRIYSNTFYGSQFAGIRLSPAREFAFRGNVIKNNILAGSRFVANDTRWPWHTRRLAGKPVQILAGRLDGFVCQNNNLFAGGRDEPYLIALGWRKPLVKRQLSVAELERTYPRLFKHNRVIAPDFVNEKNRDFHLRPGSPMIDQGIFLTRTVGKGSGSEMPVDDAGYFFGGSEIPGEKGDLIQLEGQLHTARVVDVDYDKKLLVLSQSLKWKDAQGVALRYLGRGPEIGAYEFVPGGNQPPIAAFTARPQAAHPLGVGLDGTGSFDPDGRVVRYDWDFGDGRRVAGGPAKASHVYPKPGTYTVTLKVMDDSGAGLTGVAALDLCVGRPRLSVKPTSLDFGPRATSLALEIGNAGEGTLAYRIGTSAPWLSADPSAGKCTTQVHTVAVRVDRGRQRTGVHTAAVTVDGGPGGSQEVAVSMEVPRLSRVRLIKVGQEWRFFKGTTSPPKGWNTLGFDDSTWLQGRSGIGYSDEVRYRTVLEDMRRNYVAVYMRRRFRIESPASVVALNLGVRYDDGFVAYVNGKEAARSRSMGPPNTAVRFDKLAMFKHDEESREELYRIEVTPGLRLGTENVLAIQFHNEHPKSSDVGIRPRLDATVVGGSAGAGAALAVSLFAGGGVAMLGVSLVRRRRRKSPARGGDVGLRRKPTDTASRRRRVQVLNWLAVGVTTAAILGFSHYPAELLPLGRYDKAVHALAYGLLALLLLRAISARGRLVNLLSALLRFVDRRVGLAKLAVVLGLVAVIGMGSEMTQPLVGRHRSMRDLLANFAGACVAVLLWMTLRALIKRRG